MIATDHFGFVFIREICGGFVATIQTCALELVAANQ